MVAFKGLNVILGLYKCNYSLTRGKELGAATSWKQDARPDKTRWRAGFRPRALGWPPVFQAELEDGRKIPPPGVQTLDSPSSVTMMGYHACD